MRGVVLRSVLNYLLDLRPSRKRVSAEIPFLALRARLLRYAERTTIFLAGKTTLKQA